MDDRLNLGDDGDELPEHETRPEGGEGGGLTQSGLSAEQRGPVDRDAIEAARDEDGDELAVDPDEPPPAYRQFSG